MVGRLIYPTPAWVSVSDVSSSCIVAFRGCYENRNILNFGRSVKHIPVEDLPTILQYKYYMYIHEIVHELVLPLFLTAFSTFISTVLRKKR